MTSTLGERKRNFKTVELILVSYNKMKEKREEMVIAVVGKLLQLGSRKAEKSVHPHQM